MNRFLAAIRFLTILPVPGKLGTAEEDLAGSVGFFPVVGLLIGLAAGVVAFAVPHLFSPLVGAILVVIVLLAASGGLHLDGLSDSADGLLSSRPRERALEIMKDSHVGAMGVIAIVCVLGLKAAALSEFTWDELWPRVVLMPLAGRCAIVVAMMLLPYARPENGLGSVFFRHRSATRRWALALWAVAVLAAAAWLAVALEARSMEVWRVPWWVQGLRGLVPVAAVLVVTLLFSWHCRRKIGGATGDTLGATCELAETVLILAFAASPLKYLFSD